MRLTGGQDRGRKVRAPRGLHTRPTASRVREALFNILGPPVDAVVLDLFAGTGALGLEALSRGAASAVFVERDSRALGVLIRNLKDLGFQDRAQVKASNVHAALLRLGQESIRFSWVFVDPPYATAEARRVLETLAGCSFLDSGAVIVVEHDKRNVPPDDVGSVRLTDRRFYGDTGLSFYRRDPNLV